MYSVNLKLYQFFHLPQKISATLEQYFFNRLPLVVLFNPLPPMPVNVPLVDNLVLVAGDEPDERVAHRHEGEAPVEHGLFERDKAGGEAKVDLHAIIVSIIWGFEKIYIYN